MYNENGFELDQNSTSEDSSGDVNLPLNESEAEIRQNAEFTTAENEAKESDASDDIFAQQDDSQKVSQQEYSIPEYQPNTDNLNGNNGFETNAQQAYNQNDATVYPGATYNNTQNYGGYGYNAAQNNNSGFNQPYTNTYNPYQANDNTQQGQKKYDPTLYNTGEKNKNSGMKVAIGVIAACVVVAVLVVFMSLGGSSNDEPIIASDTTTTVTTQSSAVTNQSSDSSVEIATTNSSASQKDAVWIADTVRPSVVGVMVYEDGQLAGEGSGVLMSESGEYTYVVTCDHVVNESGVTYGILLLDGRSFEAELVAGDTRTDIAVLKVKQTGLPLAEFGDSSSLKVGETIYAIGNPGGSEYFGSMTDGIVSAIDRSITATYTMTCIQHNAAINPGNSGGALVNSQGQVIGINSSKIASTEYEGMGFAVPTSIAKPVVDALIQYGYVPNRPKLGIEYAPVSSYQLYSMVVSIKGLPKGSLVIAGISEDSTLVNTDAQVGDLIIGVNGKNMDDSSALLDLIDTGAVGDTLTLTLCRIESRTYKTTTFDVQITLVEDKGTTAEEPTTQAQPNGGYYYGGSESFEDFFNDYFGEFGW